MNKYFAKLIVLGLVLAGGYFLLGRENVSSYTIPWIEARPKEITTKLNSFFNSATTTISGLVKNFTDGLLEKSAPAVTNLIDDAKTESFRVFSEAVTKKVNDLGSNLGINVRRLESPIVFGIKSGSLAYFTVKNQVTGKMDYQVDWRDGKTDSGEVMANSVNLLFHSWQKAGQYELIFKITQDAATEEYRQVISVF